MLNQNSKNTYGFTLGAQKKPILNITKSPYHSHQYSIQTPENKNYPLIPKVYSQSKSKSRHDKSEPPKRTKEFHKILNKNNKNFKFTSINKSHSPDATGKIHVFSIQNQLNDIHKNSSRQDSLHEDKKSIDFNKDDFNESGLVNILHPIKSKSDNDNFGKNSSVLNKDYLTKNDKKNNIIITDQNQSSDLLTKIPNRDPLLPKAKQNKFSKNNEILSNRSPTIDFSQQKSKNSKPYLNSYLNGDLEQLNNSEELIEEEINYDECESNNQEDLKYNNLVRIKQF